MKKVFLLFIIYFFFISSCEYFTLMSQKEWAEKAGQEDDVIIYVGGNYTDAPDYYPCYWKIKDGKSERIDVEYVGLLSNSILSIYVEDDIVYSCGYCYDPITMFNRACYWINTKKYDLEVNNPLIASTAYSIKVKSGVVFIAGDADSGACFWIEQKKSNLNINSARTIFIQQVSSSKHTMYIGGSNLKTNAQACYWKDGNITDLQPLPDAPGEASEVWSNYVIGNIVYSAGSLILDIPPITQYASLWKNNNLTLLSGGSYAYSVFVSNDDVYVAGVDSTGNNACYWKNNNYNLLGAGVSQSIYVFNDDVYNAGYSNNYASCWINKNIINLESIYNSWGYSIFVTKDIKK